jgi:hypothetical protein
MTRSFVFTALTDRDRDRDLTRGTGSKVSFFFHFSPLALAFWLLVFEVHTDMELDRVEEGLTARGSEQ